MVVPVLKGVIGRRILANFRADPDVIQRVLPAPFRPRLYQDHAIVGICLIRLEQIRPASCSASFGFSSENAAHRMAVTWEDQAGSTQEGVFIPRRDTSSILNHLAGGRVFPGEHHLASFEVQSTETRIDLRVRSQDGLVEVRVAGQVSKDLPSSSCFASLADASAFFESGCLGYSARCSSNRLDGMILKTRNWHVENLEVTDIYSSYYSDENQFP